MAIYAFVQYDGTSTEQSLNGGAWRNRGIKRQEDCYFIILRRNDELFIFF